MNWSKFLSRKLFVILVGMALVSIAGMVTHWLTNLQVIYATLCSTIVGLAALYLGANTVTKNIMGKVFNSQSNKKE